VARPSSPAERRKALVEALSALAGAWPERPGVAYAARRALLEAGLSRKKASLLARLLSPGGPLSEEEVRRSAGRPLEEEEREALLRAARPGAALLEEASPAELALALGSLGLPPPSPPPAFPEEVLPFRAALEEGGVFLVEGLPFRERYRLALLLGEGLAHAHGLEGVFLGTRTQAGAARLLPLLEARWGGFAARAGETPFLPEEVDSWLEGPGKALQAPFAAGTADHALRGVLPTAEALLRMALLLRKVPVLPVPEEDPRLFSALVAFLRWTKALGTPVLLLSPELPGRLWTELLEALGLPRVPKPKGALKRLAGAVEVLAPPPPSREVRVGEAGLPERGALLFATRKRAKEVYEALARGAALEDAGHLRRRLKDGRTLLLLHGSLPLGERRAREGAEADLLVSTWSGGGEGAPYSLQALEAPSPLALKEALLEAEEVRLLPGEPPGHLPARLFAYAVLRKEVLRVPEDLALLDPYGDPEVLAWWEEGRAEGAARVEVPETWPSGHLPPLPLRRGPGSVFLLPPEGKEAGAFLPKPVALREHAPLWEREWVWGVAHAPSRETGA